MEVEVLGPLTVRRDGERLEFGGPREQAVLACLVIRAGEVVSTEALVRGVWPRTTNLRARSTPSAPPCGSCARCWNRTDRAARRRGSCAPRRPTLLTVLELPDSRDGPLRLSVMVTAP